jgi:hypothetical protein
MSQHEDQKANHEDDHDDELKAGLALQVAVELLFQRNSTEVLLPKFQVV